MSPQTPGVPDHARKLETVGWSPKAVWATITAVVIPLAVTGAAALIEAFSANPQLFDGLPGWLRLVISAAITGAGVLLAAYKAGPGNVKIGA